MEKDNLIKKWLNDDLTAEELEVFKALENYQFYVDIVENAKNYKASEASKVDSFESFKYKKELRSKKIKPLWTINPYLKIASVFIIALGVYFAFLYKPITEINTLVHEQKSIVLPDNSKVTLNALSQISFDKYTWKDHRQLNLNGEAYFKVKKGKTFDVITDDGIVTVVGTQFSVKQRKSYFEVSCYEGSVSVTSKETYRALEPGDAYRVLNGKFVQYQTPYSEPQWLNNISSFEVVPFKEVIAELERQYDITIRYENISENPLFTGGFTHNNLDNALMSITRPLNLTYKIISPKQAIIYGHKK